MKKFFILFLVLFNFSFLFAASYFCPMKCEGSKVYAKPGDCPVCHMHLEQKAEKPKAPINSLDFRAELKSIPEKIEANKPVEIKIRILQTKNGLPVKDFDIAHEKLMHLVVVSQNLSFFAHVHPEKSEDGAFTINTSFPFGGNFILYADVTPKGGQSQIFPIAVQVAGEKGPDASTISQRAMNMTKPVGSYLTRLAMESPPVSGIPMTFQFTVKIKGEKLKNFEPYLGAPAHMIVIHEDTTLYSHAHPLDHAHIYHGSEKSMPSTNGEIRFMTTFPKPGTYKAWIEFQHKGKVITADYIIRIKS